MTGPRPFTRVIQIQIIHKKKYISPLFKRNKINHYTMYKMVWNVQHFEMYIEYKFMFRYYNIYYILYYTSGVYY